MPFPPDKNSLFHGLTEEELGELDRLHCSRRKRFAKDTVIFRAGDTPRELGVILEGKILVEGHDRFGNTTILSSLAAGRVFAETFAVMDLPSIVDFAAGEDCLIQFMDVRLMLSDAFASSTWQPKIIRNLLTVCTQKNLILSHRIYCTSPGKVRDRVLIFLSGYASQLGSREFDVPFTRQEMADFLNLDRSALSRELGRMRDEGILTFERNHFRLTDR